MRILAAILAIFIGVAASAQKKDEFEGAEDTSSKVYTVAIFSFTETGPGVAGMGAQVASMLFAKLAVNQNIWLLERSDIDKIVKDSSIKVSGSISQEQAVQIGQIAGVKFVVTGTVLKIKDKINLVAKVISTESGKMFDRKVEGSGSVDALSEKLSTDVTDLFAKDAKKLLPRILDRKALVADLRKTLGEVKRPKIFIKIEEGHSKDVKVDPVVETELQMICQELGFAFAADENDAEIVVKGQAYSDSAGRRGSLTSIRSKIEIKATDKSGNVLASEKQAAAEVDMIEEDAGRKALLQATAKASLYLIPKIGAPKK